MAFDRWKQQWADALFITLSDGRLVYYPLGPFRGYVLPDSRLQSTIVKASIAIQLATTAFEIALIIIAIWLRIDLDVALLISIFGGLLPYYLLTGRISRGLTRLPPALSTRVFAFSQDPEELWKAFVAMIFMSLLCGIVLIVRPLRLSIWILLLYLLFAIPFVAYLIYLHQRESQDTDENGIDFERNS